MSNAIALLASALALNPSADVQLLPAGEFKGRDGRPGADLTWKLGEDRGRKLAAQLSARHAVVRFSFDYEHQALQTEKNGQPAPASGWASRFEWRSGEGLFALNVQWTERARRMIAAGEYGYLSPVIAYDKRTGEISNVINAALTNIPALDMAPLAGAERLNAILTTAVREGVESLSSVELAVCRATGIDPEDFVRMSAVGSGVMEGDAVARLSEAELATCRACGLSPEDFLATKENSGRDPWDTPAEWDMTDDELSVCRATGVAPEDFIEARSRLD